MELPILITTCFVFLSAIRESMDLEFIRDLNRWSKNLLHLASSRLFAQCPLARPVAHTNSELKRFKIAVDNQFRYVVHDAQEMQFHQRFRYDI